MSSSFKNGNTDNELLWVFGGLFLFVIGAWFFGHEHISAFVMRVRSYEAYLLIFDETGQTEIRKWIASTHPKDVTIGQLWQSGAMAGWSLRFLVGGVVTALFAYLVYRSPDRGDRYTRTYDMTALARQEAEEWKVIKPVLGQHLEKISLDDPVNGMRMRPRDYARKHKIIMRESALGERAHGPNVEKIKDNMDAMLLDQARTIFGKQLGRLWQGTPALRTHERCLFAAFAAQANNDGGLAKKIIDDLAVAYLRARNAKDASQINSLHAQKALHLYGNTKVVQKTEARHAYARTVLISMLEKARENGVLPPSWFRWLKTVDRITWYALNDLGLDVASVEAAGIRAHWLAELALGKRIVNPMIDSAVAGLKTYLEEITDEEIDD